MRRIMVNEALAYLRQQRRILDNVGIEEATAIPDYGYADQNLEASEIMEMIGRLPFGYRTVFNLYAIEGFTHQEIAEMLGITESTSKSQLHRARAHLQKMVMEWETVAKRRDDGKYGNNNWSKSI